MRGYKTVLKLFTHEAADLVPILDELKAIDIADHTVSQWVSAWMMKHATNGDYSFYALRVSIFAT